MLILGDLLEHIDECEVEVCNGSGTTLFVLTLKALEKSGLYMSDQLLDSEVLTINYSNVNRLRVNVSIHEEVTE